MTSGEHDGNDPLRRPAAFRTDDPNLRITPLPEFEIDDGESQAPTTYKIQKQIRRRYGWGALLFTALGGLLSLAAGLWLTQFVQVLFGRDDWIGWTALALVCVAAFAAAMICANEISGLVRMRRTHRIRESADRVLRSEDHDTAVSTLAALLSLYGRRKSLHWARARLREHEGDIRDGKELLILGERELLGPLDREARTLIADSAKRVSLVTAISPATIIDVGFVGFENLRLLRRLATLYGGRPGTIGLIRLARMVFTHLAITGGIALSSDLIQQMIGHKLTAKISARLGEGLVNGALTARIGIAALDICRPLPFIEAQPPRFRDFLAEIMKTKNNVPDGE